MERIKKKKGIFDETFIKKSLNSGNFRLSIMIIGKILADHWKHFLLSSGFFSTIVCFNNYNAGKLTKNLVTLESSSDNLLESIRDILDSGEEENISIDDLRERLSNNKKNNLETNNEKWNKVTYSAINIAEKEWRRTDISKKTVANRIKLELEKKWSPKIDQRNYEIPFIFPFFGEVKIKNIGISDFLKILVVIFTVIKPLMSIQHYFVNDVLKEVVEQQLKLDLFKVAVSSEFDKSSGLGKELITQFTANIEMISNRVPHLIDRITYVSVSILIYVYYDLFKSSDSGLGIGMTISVISLLSLIFIIQWFLLKKSVNMGIKTRQRFEEDSQFIIERLSKIQKIKIMASEEYETNKLKNRLRKTFKENWNFLIWNTLFNSVPQYFVIPNVPIIFLVILYFSFSSQKEDSLLRTSLYFFSRFYVIARTCNDAEKIVVSFSAMESIVGEFRRLALIINSLNENKKNTEPAITEKVEGKIEGEDITLNKIFFSYPRRANMEIIKGLDFTFKKGKVYGIIGANGSGKSTIIKLIMGLFKEYKGTIKIGNIDIRNIRNSDILLKTCFISNNPEFFNMSIKDNVLYPRRSNDEDELRNGAEKVGLYDFIESLPAKFDTIISEKSDLSEGQKQRIDFIRAFIKKYNFFFFDEPQSNVRRKEKMIILDTFFKERKEKYPESIVILIDHDSSTLRYADEIYQFMGDSLKRINFEDLMEQDAREQLLGNENKTDE